MDIPDELDLPVELVLQIVRDGAGQWDTRRIDLELGWRGTPTKRSIFEELLSLHDAGLIKAIDFGQAETGPRWRLTALGMQYLDDPALFGDVLATSPDSQELARCVDEEADLDSAGQQSQGTSGLSLSNQFGH